MLPTGSSSLDAERAFTRMSRSRRRAALARWLRRDRVGHGQLPVYEEGMLRRRARQPGASGIREIPLCAIQGTLEPSRPTVVFWGLATGGVAAVMLLVGGKDALTGLQTITIVAALPFVLVMIGLAVALVKDLRHDPLMVRQKYAAEAMEQAVIAGVTEHGDDFVISVDRDPAAD